MPKNNLDIFICADAKIEVPVKNGSYRVVSKGRLTKKDTGLRTTQAKCGDLKLDDGFYSALWYMYHVWKNVKTPEYVGFCSPGMYFGFMDDVPDMGKTFSEVDAVLCNPFNFSGTILQQYGESHNVKDLELVGKLIKDYYPEYAEAYDLTMGINKFSPCNMFIMRKADFEAYCEFVFGVLDKFIEVIGTDIEKHISDNIANYTTSNKDIKYQSMIGGFLGERLLNVFVNKRFKNVRYYKPVCPR